MNCPSKILIKGSRCAPFFLILSLMLPGGCSFKKFDLHILNSLPTHLPTHLPDNLPGLPQDIPFTSLPLGQWLSEGPVKPIAMAMCLPKDCAYPVSIGLFETQDKGLLEKPDWPGVTLIQKGSVSGYHVSVTSKPSSAFLQKQAELVLLFWQKGEMTRFLIVAGTNRDFILHMAFQVAAEDLL